MHWQLSSDAVALLADETFDFIYIGARHGYTAVMEILHARYGCAACWQRIRARPQQRATADEAAERLRQSAAVTSAASAATLGQAIL